MGCSADSSTGEALVKLNDENTGIYAGHAYSILEIIEIPDESLKDKLNSNGNPKTHLTHRILKLRNPWGYGEWKLNWSENEEYNSKFL